MKVSFLFFCLPLLFWFLFLLIPFTWLISESCWYSNVGAKQPNYLVTADDVDTYLAIEVQPLDNRKRQVLSCYWLQDAHSYVLSVLGNMSVHVYIVSLPNLFIFIFFIFSFGGEVLDLQYEWDLITKIFMGLSNYIDN